MTIRISASPSRPRCSQRAPITETAPDGNTAVQYCNEDPPDLVVLDMMLPGRSGFLVLEKIKGREDSPLVIMVTANEGKRHQEYADAIGVDAYMIKPVPLASLVETRPLSSIAERKQERLI